MITDNTDIIYLSTVCNYHPFLPLQRYKDSNNEEKDLLPWEVQQRQREERERRFLSRTDSDRTRIMTEREKQLAYARKLGQYH